MNLKKIIPLSLCVLLGVFGLTVLFGNKEAPLAPFKKIPHIEAKKIIKDIYLEITGYGISDREVKFIKRSGGAATYGEILFNSAKKVLEHFNPTKEDVFYDLGSGVGKLVVHAYLATNVKKSVGVELSATRHDNAAKALNRLAERGSFDPNREISFINDNILKVDLSDATLIFMCATCYSPELMEQIAQKLLALNKKVKVATLKEFKPNDRIKKLESIRLPMSWSREKGSPVHLYEFLPKEPKSKT